MIVYIAKIKPGADFVDFIRSGPDYIVVPLNDKGDQCEFDKFEEGTYKVDLHIYMGYKRVNYVRDFDISSHHPYASWHTTTGSGTQIVK